ncbi:MAG: hypothetical protein HYS65_11315, partial [Betaproteobacteria bacterium]|nr:hypothetical protein [Betaproteobacteria bacterium]
VTSALLYAMLYYFSQNPLLLPLGFLVPSIGFDSIFWALYHGEKEIGVTVHFVTAELDGGPVILQDAVRVFPHDTEDTLIARVHRVDELPARNPHAPERQQRGEHVPAVARLVSRVAARRQHARRIGVEASEIMFGERAARRGELIETRELREAHAGVHVGKVELASGHIDIARAVGQPRNAVKAQLLGELRFVGVVEHQRAALDRGHVLVGVEAECHQVAKGADSAAAPARADRERGILDDPQTVFAREAVQAIHVDRQAGEMRRQYRAGGRRDRGRGLRQIDVARREVAIDEHRFRADFDDHVGRGEEALRGGNHFVAGADAANLQRDFDGCRGGGQRAHRAAAEILRQCALEGDDLGAACDPSRTQDGGDALDRRFVQRGPREGQVGGRAHERATM